jgi:hypothetical protein
MRPDDDDAPLIEQTPQDFADEEERPFEREARARRDDDDEGGLPAGGTTPTPVAADGTAAGESRRPGV